MKMEILASWMNQDSFILAEESRIAGNVLVINQCNQHGIAEEMHGSSRWRMILTKDRGLSRSRNLALDNAEAEICLLCDDDEIFADGYEAIIEESFRKLPEADIIGFNVEGKETRLEQKIQRIGKWKSLRLSSVQLAFRRESIEKYGLRFDECLGSGSGNGPGEENKFLLDAIRKGLKLYYDPKTIARLRDGNLQADTSEWFSGFDKTFFYQRGGGTRYMLGLPVSVAYGFYYLYAKRRFYRSELTTWQAARALFAGIWENRVSKQAWKEKKKCKK